MENKEIEVRFLNIDKSALVDKLIAIGAQDKNEILLSETIFYDPDLSWLEERRFVRIRKSGETIKFTYKENKDQTIDSAFEIEFEISDKKEAEKFLEKVGVVAYREQEKKRHSFCVENFNIDIDTWPNIPPYVEIEGPSEEALREFSKALGFDWNDAVFEDAKFILENHYNVPLKEKRIFKF